MVVEILQRINHVACHSAFKFARFSFAFSTSNFQHAERECKIYDTTVAKPSLKIARSSLSIFFIIASIRLAFES